MEAMLAGKPRSVAIGVLRALIVPLREHWGDIPGFVKAGQEVLAREGAGALYSEKDSPAHLDQIYKQTQRARANYFRHIPNVAQLDALYKELDLTAAKAASPLQQGVLWLASRLQQQAIGYLAEPKSQEQLRKVQESVGERRAVLTRSLGNLEQITLDKIEAELGGLAQVALGGPLKAFEQTVLAGHLLETVREAARRPPRKDVDSDQAPRNDALTQLFATLIEPVRRAELNEARVRYARLGEDEKNRRFNEFRRTLHRLAAEVAPFAPDGFEAFCTAIELRMYPYPEPMQFIRSFARPIWNNGVQSNLFTNCTTPQSVQHTYESLAKSRQGNPVVLELARAFAVRNFKQTDKGGEGVVLAEIDLKAEFGWPTSMAELKAAL